VNELRMLPKLPIDLQTIHSSYNKMRKNYINEKLSITRHKKRVLTFRQELVAKILHPSKVQKYIEMYGLDWDEYV
jgi:hypothetical protein